MLIGPARVAPDPWNTPGVATKQQKQARKAAKARIDAEHEERRAPTHAANLAREKEVLDRHKDALSRVDALAHRQRDVGEQLDQELGVMLDQGEVLDAIEKRQQETGFLVGLTRRFTARRDRLERRSVSETLLRQYEQVHTRLAGAAAFVDELRLCAAEMQGDVDSLHGELATAITEEKRLAQQIGALERALDLLETESGDGAARKKDQLEFDQRTASAELALWRTRAGIARNGLPPARSLRDTVMTLHDEMARYVETARGTVRSAGRRIQALGTAADAPAVVAELQESLDDLRHAMTATEQYLRSTQELYTRVLPKLSEELETHLATQGKTIDSGATTRAEARAQAEQALVEAAEAELAELLGEDP